MVTAGYDIGTCDGMNEKGLVANLLFLTESSYFRPDDNRPVMGLSIWTQYVLDNFATVDEAVAELSKEVFRIDDPDLPNGAKSTLHLSISDASGNSAIFEYLNGNLVIHEGRECQVMTNSPTYDKQLTLNDYWQQIGGLVMLPGTNRASDRFVRASFYIHAIPQTSNFREAVAGVFSVMRNVSVPLGITTPDQPNISSTRWRTVADQKNKVYYFESTLSPDIFWVDFKSLDFKAGTPIKKLTLTDGEIYAGNTAKDFKDSKPLPFLFQAIGEAITKQIMTIHRYDRLCFRNKSITVAPNTFRIPISFRLYSLSNKTTPNTPTKDTNTAIKLKNKICLPSSSSFWYKFSWILLNKWISRG